MTEKEKFMEQALNDAKYQIEMSGKCIKPCFKHFKTPAVTEGESECMNNCVAKGLELLARY